MFSIVKSLFAAINSVFSFLSQRQLVQAGKDSLAVEQGEKSADAVAQSIVVRDKAAVDASLVPIGNSLPDDGFRRD